MDSAVQTVSNDEFVAPPRGHRPSFGDAQDRTAADTIAALPEIDYLVIVAGSFDLLVEIVCEDDDGLLHLLNDKIRAVPGVTSTDTFTYLKICKETYSWGTR